jgi:DNA (cytosine-5)-methyltransferase 1
MRLLIFVVIAFISLALLDVDDIAEIVANSQPMKSVDLFAGAGGLSCGLRMAGFRSILGSDIHPIYAETYKLNHPKAKVITNDIRELSDEDILMLTGLKVGELDLMAGGPPCQGFSINAPIRTLDDQRNHLFKEYLRIAKTLRPKAILIENVPGLVSLGKGTVVRAIYRYLENMGYSVNHKILFAGHYGVPQMRFRTIFVAIRDGAKFNFPEPTHNASAKANFSGAKELCFPLSPSPLFAQNLMPKTTVWDAISDLPILKLGESIHDGQYGAPAANSFQEFLRKDSSGVFNHACARLGASNLERLRHIPQGGSWRDIPIELLPEGLKRARRSDHTKRYGRLHPDELCSTILTKCDPHWGSFFHPTQARAISVREAARLQSFPDKYVFTGNLTQQFEQVGNAVPPLMASAIGEAIKKAIK